jgi:hypothetical protein
MQKKPGKVLRKDSVRDAQMEQEIRDDDSDFLNDVEKIIFIFVKEPQTVG